MKSIKTFSEIPINDIPHVRGKNVPKNSLTLQL